MPGSYRVVSGKSIPSMSKYFDSQTGTEAGGPADLRGPLHLVGRYGLAPERFASITDGTSNTLMVGEYATRTHPSRRTFWADSWNQYSLSAGTTEIRTLYDDYDACIAAGGDGGDAACKRGWGSFHSGNINFLLCDGSVRSISLNIDLNTFANMTTIAGGEVIGDF